MWETQVNQFQDKFGLPSLKLNLPEGVGEGELFVNNKSLTTAELNGESPCLLSTVEAEKIIPKIEEKFSLQNAAKALSKILNRGTKGKVILNP